MFICPRCHSSDAQILSQSPVEGCWTLYLCPVCFYSWRSTEPEELTQPDKYQKQFQINPQAIPSFPVVPAIPQKRTEKH